MSRLVPLLIGIFPVLVFHTTHWLSANEGYVQWCNPYWDSCTSISATGRDGTAFFVFKAAMIPAALLLFYYWRITWNKMSLAVFPERVNRATPIIGFIGAFFLIVYTVALGAEGAGFQLQRRIGIILFFTMTYLCQLLFCQQAEKYNVKDPTLPIQVTLFTVILGIGLLTLVLDRTLPNYEDDLRDAFEWIIALLLQSYFVIGFFSWKALDKIASSKFS